MKNNFEHAPNELFDWIQHLSFDELNDAQKETVLKFISQDEYQELYLSSQNIIRDLKNDIFLHSRKDELFDVFDQTYPNKSQLINTTHIWKAASVLLFISTLWFAFSSKKNINATTELVRDTIYMTKPSIAKIQPRDTVFIERIVEKEPKPRLISSTKIKISNLHNQEIEIAKNDAIEFPKQENDFAVVSVEHANNISNSIKRNSKKDDSLESKFKFISL